MANQPSPYPVLCASFNQDNSYFAVGTKLGFKIFQADTGRLCYEKDIGAFSIVEMRFSSSLLAIVGAGEQPALSPRRLCLFNTTTGAPLQELNFLTSVLAVRLSKQRLIVLLEDKTFIYDIDRLSILSTIDTIPNPKGLCTFSHKPEACFLALPASTAKGSVLVYNVMDLQSHCEIEAHRSPLAAMVLSSDGAYLATASEQGTIVRVHTISEGTKHVNSGVDIIDITLEATRKLRGQLDYDMHNEWGSFPCFTSCVSDSHKLKYFSFRRGTYPSTIFSLSFGLSLELPDVLAATSSSGSLHVFMLASAINQRSRASGSFIGSIIPGSISDVLDPAHHHVLHKAVPEGVRSYAVIRKVEKVVDNSASQVLSFRAVISIISYNGYFQEYMLSINCKNEAAWSLDREYNLLTAIPDTNPAS